MYLYMQPIRFQYAWVTHLNKNNVHAFANPRLSFLSAGLVAVRSLWEIGAEGRDAGYFFHNCK